jgi:hypothetical protein
VELWNSSAGVAPFTGRKPVKKFPRRDKAVRRNWVTIRRLGSAIAPAPPEEAKPAGGPKKDGYDDGRPAGLVWSSPV